MPDDEAARRVVDAFVDDLGDEEYLLWLALAATQWQVGRLQPEIRDRALDIIDSGRALEQWTEEATRSAVAQRRAALAKLRERLAGAQHVTGRRADRHGDTSRIFHRVTSWRAPPPTAQ